MTFPSGRLSRVLTSNKKKKGLGTGLNGSQLFFCCFCFLLASLEMFHVNSLIYLFIYFFGRLRKVFSAKAANGESAARGASLAAKVP